MEKKAHDETEVRFLRLTTGEDIVAEVLETDGDQLILINPCKLLYTNSLKPGYLSISLMQWVFTKVADVQMFEMPRSAVLLSSTPNQKLNDYYWSTIEHFQNKAKDLSARTEFDVDDGVDEEDLTTTESQEALDMLTKLLESFGKPDKDKLH